MVAEVEVEHEGLEPHELNVIDDYDDHEYLVIYHELLIIILHDEADIVDMVIIKVEILLDELHHEHKHLVMLHAIDDDDDELLQMQVIENEELVYLY